VIAAVVFDLDGVLIDSEQVWAQAREQVAREHGGHWDECATRAMMGMSAPKWSQYMHTELGVSLTPAEISREVVARLLALYRQHLPLLPGAREALAALAEHWPLALASSANREVIEVVLELARVASLFAATVSAEAVAHGKPAPDVYLEAARRLEIAPGSCAAVEDSTNGLRAAAAAGMHVIAYPNTRFPPSPEALALADRVIDSLDDLRPALLEALMPRVG
jgi:HAD superfamily hydrolase (TIGR01509 family)